jgi:putative transposase
VNAAINIKVAGGQSETLNGSGGKRKTSVKEGSVLGWHQQAKDHFN